METNTPTSMNLSIQEIATACNGRLILQSIPRNIKVTSIVLDSRKVTAGGVFVATPGERVDGHKFILDVFQKGVHLVICQKSPNKWRQNTDCPQRNGAAIFW